MFGHLCQLKHSPTFNHLTPQLMHVCGWHCTQPAFFYTCESECHRQMVVLSSSSSASLHTCCVCMHVCVWLLTSCCQKPLWVHSWCCVSVIVCLCWRRHASQLSTSLCKGCVCMCVWDGGDDRKNGWPVPQCVCPHASAISCINCRDVCACLLLLQTKVSS